ncbi:hypothetical protein IW262DRAFT_1278842, partial [Armillaria fumosa]
KDAINVALTRARKSLTYWIPLAFTEKGIVIVVLPLKQLGTQFSSWLNIVNSKGLSAISVTAKNSSKQLHSVCNEFTHLFPSHRLQCVANETISGTGKGSEIGGMQSFSQTCATHHHKRCQSL